MTKSIAEIAEEIEANIIDEMLEPITILIPDLETCSITLVGGANVLIKLNPENREEISELLRNIQDQETVMQVFDILTGGGVRFEI